VYYVNNTMELSTCSLQRRKSNSRNTKSTFSDFLQFKKHSNYQFPQSRHWV